MMLLNNLSLGICMQVIYWLSWSVWPVIGAIETKRQHQYAKMHQKDNPVNVIIILADDLGYGDTSVYPFMGSGIYTPQLEKMAARGTIMTNFHSAAPVCTPTRVSILTGMFPWRLGVKGVYEYGEKGKSNRDDWLAHIPTIAMAFRDAGYVTGHSGKWHAGGMRNDDWEMRVLPDLGSESLPGSRRCPHPGPNQQGFDEYVSVLDGPGSQRQGLYQVNAVLYSQGCEILLRNDSHIGKLGEDTSQKEYLFDCEVRHAIRMIKYSISVQRPFFINLWFHAPHGPWEFIEDYRHFYDRPRQARLDECMKLHGQNEKYCQLAVKPERKFNSFAQYNTMITGMDNSIGNLLNAIKTFGIERDTIIVFVSDNGPENGVGTVGSPYRATSGHRGNKRFLYEGGIRVPCIWQWTGIIPKKKESAVLGVTTDIFPTVLEAAGIPLPKNARVDGISLLTELKSTHHHKSVYHKKSKRIYFDRMSLWHAEYEGPRSTVAILYDFKVTLNEKDHPYEIFDLLNDPFEKINLIESLSNTPIEEIKAWADDSQVAQISPSYLLTNTSRVDQSVHRLLVSKTYQMLYDFANYGNEAHKQYLVLNPGRNYVPTVESDVRSVTNNIYRVTSKEKAIKIRESTITKGFCSTPCSCAVPASNDIPNLPFQSVPIARQYLNPHGLINGTALLFDKNYYNTHFI